MDFFQGFGKKISSAAKTVGKKTAEATEVARINGRIAQRKDEVEALFAQIGKAYYAMRASGGHDGAMEALSIRIDELKKEIDDMVRAVDAIHQVVRCPSCGEAQSEEASFCSSCGTKLMKIKRPEPEKPQAPEEKVGESAAEEREGPACESKPTPTTADVTITWPEAVEKKEEDAEEDGE